MQQFATQKILAVGSRVSPIAKVRMGSYSYANQRKFRRSHMERLAVKLEVVAIMCRLWTGAYAQHLTQRASKAAAIDSVYSVQE